MCKSINSIVCLVVFIVFDNPLQARGGMGHSKEHARIQKAEMMFEQLRLSEDQKSKIKAIRAAKKAKKESLVIQSKQARDALKAAMQNPKTSNSELNELHEKMITAKAEVMRQRFASMLEVRAILTPEQLQNWGESMQRRQRRHRMKGPGRQGPWGRAPSIYMDQNED